MHLSLRKLVSGAALASLVAIGLPGVASAGSQTSHPTRHHHRRHHDNRIPQHNGGDHDADNNGGPTDGDGNV
jgi:hypothetical protein